MTTVGVQDGFHEETRKVSTLTSSVAGTKDGWVRGEPLKVPGAEIVSTIYADLSALIATYGSLAQKDTDEFDQFAVNIEVRDREDAEK